MYFLGKFELTQKIQYDDLSSGSLILGADLTVNEAHFGPAFFLCFQAHLMNRKHISNEN